MGSTYSNVNYSNNIQYLVYRSVPNIGIIPMLEKGEIDCKIQGNIIGDNYTKNHDTNGLLLRPIAHNMIPSIQNDELYCWAIFENTILKNKYYHMRNNKNTFTDENINGFTQELYDDSNLDSDSNYKVFIQSSSPITIKPYLKYIVVMPHKVVDDEKEHHEEYTYFTVKEMKLLVKNKYPDAKFIIIYKLDDLKKLEKELFGDDARNATYIKFNSNTSAEGHYENNMTISIGIR